MSSPSSSVVSSPSPSPSPPPPPHLPALAQPRTLYITLFDDSIACFLDRDPTSALDAPDHAIARPVPHAMTAVAGYLATIDLSRCETLTFRGLDLDLIDSRAGFLMPAISTMLDDLWQNGTALTRLALLGCDHSQHVLALLGLCTFPALASLDVTGSAPPRHFVLAALDGRSGKCAPLAHLLLDHFPLDSCFRVWMYYALFARVRVLELAPPV